MPGTREVNSPVAASPLLTEGQAAEILGCSKDRLSRRRRAGEVPEGVIVHPLGLLRYVREKLISWASAQHEGAAQVGK